MKKDFLFILDLDMTLVDSLKVFYNTYNTLLKKWTGKNISYKEFYRRFCEDSLDISVKNKLEFWDEFKRNYLPSSIKDIKLLPGAYELVKKITEKGYPIIIVSGRGTSSEQIRKELKALGIGDFIDEIITLSWKIKNPNLNPFDKKNSIKKIIKKYKPEKCILIGDYIEDMKAGKSNNCYCIGVTSGCKSPSKLKDSGADIVLDNLLQVINHLEKTGVL